jgi:hypothetical protein
MLDIIEDSWLYQEVTEKTLQKGIQQGIQRATLRIITRRFPELEAFAREIIEKISDTNQLELLTSELSIAPDQGRVQEPLCSFASGA